MMHVEVTSGEARELRRTLDAALQQLLTELSREEPALSREELRARYQTLSAVRHQLDAHLAGAQVYG